LQLALQLIEQDILAVARLSVTYVQHQGLPSLPHDQDGEVQPEAVEVSTYTSPNDV
jgi:hypothetical protein